MIDDGDQIEDEGAGFPLASEAAGRLRKAPTAFRTISEVADELHIPQHVLRFWETRFPQVKPLKRGGGRRYYRPDDITLLRSISNLLYIQGYTIKGVQRLLREGGGALPDDIPPPSEAERLEADDADPGAPGHEATVPAGAAPATTHAAPAREESPLAPASLHDEIPGLLDGGRSQAILVAERDVAADAMRVAMRDALAELEAIRALL